MMCQFGRLTEALARFEDGLRLEAMRPCSGNLAVARQAQDGLTEARRLSEEAAVRYRQLGYVRGMASQLGTWYLARQYRIIANPTDASALRPLAAISTAYVRLR
jgi:hypothetical protein